MAYSKWRLTENDQKHYRNVWDHLREIITDEKFLDEVSFNGVNFYAAISMFVFAGRLAGPPDNKKRLKKTLKIMKDMHKGAVHVAKEHYRNIKNESTD